MKKILLFLIAVLTSLQTFAQDPDLFQTWYLYEIDFESGQSILVENFNPPINPTLIIAPSFDFYGDGACNTFEGLFTYFPPESLEVANESHGTTSCGFNEDMFEDEYFDFFFPGMGMSYYLESDPDGYQTLFLTGGIFTTCKFRNTPVLTRPEFQEPTISVYPNPVKNELFIASEGILIEKITVNSFSGQLILVSGNVQNSIDVSGLSEGIYFIEIFSSEGSSIQKFIRK